MAATKDYQAEQDLLGAFLAERCLHWPNYQAKVSVVYAAYEDLCDQSGERFVSKRKFCAALRQKGFEGYTNNNLWFRGVAVADQRDETRDEGRFSG